MKPDKIFECSCADGFTGDFCEFKTEQDHLLFFHENDALVFNADGRLFEEKAVIENLDIQSANTIEPLVSGAAYSCSTMLNGEAIIFEFTNLQVHFETK